MSVILYASGWFGTRKPLWADGIANVGLIKGML